MLMLLYIFASQVNGFIETLYKNDIYCFDSC